MQTMSSSQANANVVFNEAMETHAHTELFGKRHPATTGLTWAFYGGRWGGTSVADGTVTLTGSATNYVVAARSNGAVSTSTGTTNWNNTQAYARLYKLTTSSTAVTATEDHRAGPYGMFWPHVITANFSTDYSVTGVEETLIHPSADTTGRTVTLPANSSIALPPGHTLTIINENSAGTVTIAITTDTMRLAGAGTTGSRTLAANGIAVAIKTSSTNWLISGTGLT